ncbi:MAG: hypothetical protein AAGA30_11930, partial [Planctomycetota bacterium]
MQISSPTALIALALLALPVGNALAQKNNSFDWPRIYCSEGMYELDEQLEKEIPFSLERYTELEPQVNREQLYLQVFIEFLSSKTWFRKHGSIFIVEGKIRNRSLLK